MMELYMGQLLQLRYPTIDDLCKRVFRLRSQIGSSTRIKGWKRDLDRAFKQVYGDPFDWPLMGIVWQGALFFDKKTMMGCRSAPYCCQRTTSFIHHIMKNIDHYVANYVDDFMGIDVESRAWQAFHTLNYLLRDLGVLESENKAIPPSDVIEFLGVLFDFINGTISMMPTRLQEF